MIFYTYNSQLIHRSSERRTRIWICVIRSFTKKKKYLKPTREILREQNIGTTCF